MKKNSLDQSGRVFEQQQTTIGQEPCTPGISYNSSGSCFIIQTNCNIYVGTASMNKDGLCCDNDVSTSGLEGLDECVNSINDSDDVHTAPVKGSQTSPIGGITVTPKK